MDCFLIGTAAINQLNQPSTSVEWLVQSLRMFLRNDETIETITIGEVRKALRNAIALVNFLQLKLIDSNQ